MRLPPFYRSLSYYDWEKKDLAIRIDLSFAFSQFRLHPKALHVSSFLTNGRLLQFTRLPMGMPQSPAILQSLLHQLLTAFNPQPPLVTSFW
jgi:hypothetical protein